MACHINLRAIPLTGNALESKKDNSTEKEFVMQEEGQDSESSKKDGDDFLDIKSSQVSSKIGKNTSCHDEGKKSKDFWEHDSRRRDNHHGHERNSFYEERFWVGDSKKKGNREADRSFQYKDESDRSKDRDLKRNIDAREIWDILLKKDVRYRPGDSKGKEDRLEVKKMEWCKKRRLFIERQGEQDRGQRDRPWSCREDYQSGQDLHEKLRKKERFQQELEKHLEHFQRPKSNCEQFKIPFSEEPMEFEKSKKDEEEESDQMSDTDTESAQISTEKDEEKAEQAKLEGKKTSPANVKKEFLPPAISTESTTPQLSVYLPAIQGCRSVEEFHCLNRIEEGTYGIVYRARDKRTEEIVALKRLKMEKEKEGFPITSLREINTLLVAQHPNIVTVREIVVGNHMDKIYIVMDYMEHDLMSLMEIMEEPFSVGEVKTLMLQLLCAVAHLHDNWILHRDLKTSNLLLSHKGILKVGDFGLAREYGSPLKPYTPIVVTLWYRAPELLLGAKQYSTPIDLWSVGCIFGELLLKKPLFPGRSEGDQLNRIFKDLGSPNEKIWSGYNELPMVKKVKFANYPYNKLRSRFADVDNFTGLGFDLLNRFLTYNPTQRIAAEDAKIHGFFNEEPKPVDPNMFPRWPARSEQRYRKARSQNPPPRGKQCARQMGNTKGLMAATGFHTTVIRKGHSAKSSGFSLKF